LGEGGRTKEIDYRVRRYWRERKSDTGKKIDRVQTSSDYSILFMITNCTVSSISLRSTTLVSRFTIRHSGQREQKVCTASCQDIGAQTLLTSNPHQRSTYAAQTNNQVPFRMNASGEDDELPDAPTVRRSERR